MKCGQLVRKEVKFRAPINDNTNNLSSEDIYGYTLTAQITNT